MSPTPQEHNTTPQLEETMVVADENRVVISGMAGLYPQSRNIKDLENILYNKLNPISSDDLRWQYFHPEVTQFTGSVPDLNHFDAQFFKVHFHLGTNMDSMSRKMLEQAFMAIYDAGLSPEHLSGKKVGVYVGTCFSETEKVVFYQTDLKTGLGIAGCSKAMFANRISYWLNAKGPSVSIDDACCSSTAALEQAFRAISRGECEAAIVGGANLCLHPQSSVHYGRIMNISLDGKTKSFAEDAAGCAKSEAINVLFLQKAKDAKRIYADVIHVKCEFTSLLDGETGPRYGFYRDSANTAKFLNKFYEDAGVPPNLVEYVEAFGSAVPEADKSELETIDTVFCKDKKEPLLIGSVMSNIGYGEAASGISAVTKVLLGFHKGEIAGNLHCETPRKDITALQEGRMQVVTDNQSFGRTYAAVNSMSVTGVNAHVLLYGHYKPKNLYRYKTNIPRLVIISGRQESSVEMVIGRLKSQPIDAEELALLHNIHEANISGHLGKGFVILDTNSENKTVSLSEKCNYFDGARRPLWFVYSGMGSQWAGMGAQLMRIPIFSAAIQRCHKALEPKGIDIVHIITSTDKTIFNNILYSFVGITAVQIGLTDILLELGLVPDNIIGHSMGELGCAYGDGCLTAEETIMSAYSRGLVSLETPFIRGLMAAVGIGFRQMSKMCPPDIEIACHNSSESCTISGPADAMRSFVADLTAKSIFAKEVPCSNIAYHSRYIAEAGPVLLKYLKDVIPEPRARSERWVSTSVPQNRWDEPCARFSSAEYHTNNLLNPVLFEETCKIIPKNAVLVELAPHGLLQAILRRSLPDSCTNIPLTRRGHNDNVIMVLEAIGKLYTEGYNPKVRVLYPEVEFPVATGTPFLSHYVDWAHQEIWALPLFESARRTTAASCTFVVIIHDDEYSYFKGHVIKSKILVPFSFALVAAWDTLAMSLNVPKKSLNVEFHDVKFYVQPTLNNQKMVKLCVSLHRGNGRFQIMNDNSKVATGTITCSVLPKTMFFEKSSSLKEDHNFSARDVYQILYERGYNYSGIFRSIHSANETLSEAKVLWKDNWVTFLDGLFQLNILKYTQGAVAQPDRIRKIVINVREHDYSIDLIKMNNDHATNVIEAQLNEVQDRTRCGGVLIESMRFHYPLQINSDRITLQTLKFVPRFQSDIDISTSLRVFLQIIAENINKKNINVIGIDHNNSELFGEIESIAKEGQLPGIKVNFKRLCENKNVSDNADLIIVKNLSNNKKICRFLSKIKTNIFILNEEDLMNESTCNFPANRYQTVSVHKNAKTKMELACWKPTLPAGNTSAFTVRSESDLPLLTHARNNLNSQSALLVLSSYPPTNELVKLVKQWRNEATRNRINLIMLNNQVNEISLDEEPDLNLAFNIYQNGIWGGEYYLPLEQSTIVADKKTLQSKLIGDINSLHWVQAPTFDQTGTLVTVHYAGISVADVKRALGAGSLSNDKRTCNSYGFEFSGVTQRGERVMGLVSHGAASSHVMVQPEMMWPLPSYWSLEDAATVPFAYMYAYYCLVLKTEHKILTNDVEQYTVLIHGGAGALGQALISIALAMGYRVFTTVSNLLKKRFLLQLFPELNENHIGNSRDSSFRDTVRIATNGRGCNLVICCLKDELKNTSFQCLGPAGILLDTVQILNQQNYAMGMSNLFDSKSYVTLDITSIINNPKSEEFQKLHDLVSEGIALGHVRPLSRVTYAPLEAPRAFHLLSASRHRGRVLLRMQDSLPSVKPNFSIEAAGYHTIICEESNLLGLQLADKLIDCGAKKLHLHVNNRTPHLQYKLRTWKNQKIEVNVSFGVLGNMSDVIDMLNNAKPMEGIHIISTNSNQEPLITYLDLATRKICPTLKYFLILSTEYSCGYSISLQRAKIGLPVTFLDLSMLEIFKDLNDITWYHGAIEAAIRALNSSEPILMVQTKPSKTTTMLHHIAALTDLNITEKTSKIASLKELGLSTDTPSYVCAFLRDVYNISLEEEDIPLLTMEKINELEAKTKETHFEQVNGLGMFYSYVDPDELMATTEMVLMPTLINGATMRDDEFDVNDTYLYIVPGLEGHYARFKTLCESLKLPALVLQPGLDRPELTPHELAVKYSKVLQKKVGLKKTFYILGFETGVNVALELAAILEDNGLTGTVFCLGDGPAETKALVESELSAFETEEALQLAVAQHMFTLMAPNSAVSALSAVQNKSSWHERLDVCVRTLLGQVPHSAQYTREILQAAYSRIEALRRHTPEPRVLRSRLVLLRAQSDTQSTECSLQLYSSCAYVVHELSTPIIYATADLRVPAIINRLLDKDLIETFQKKNLCESYLINADAFMKCSNK